MLDSEYIIAYQKTISEGQKNKTKNKIQKNRHKETLLVMNMSITLTVLTAAQVCAYSNANCIH